MPITAMENKPQHPRPSETLRDLSVEAVTAELYFRSLLPKLKTAAVSSFGEFQSGKYKKGLTKLLFACETFLNEVDQSICASVIPASALRSKSCKNVVDPSKSTAEITLSVAFNELPTLGCNRFCLVLLTENVSGGEVRVDPSFAAWVKDIISNKENVK